MYFTHNSFSSMPCYKLWNFINLCKQIKTKEYKASTGHMIFVSFINLYIFWITKFKEIPHRKKSNSSQSTMLTIKECWHLKAFSGNYCLFYLMKSVFLDSDSLLGLGSVLCTSMNSSHPLMLFSYLLLLGSDLCIQLFLTIMFFLYNLLVFVCEEKAINNGCSQSHILYLLWREMSKLISFPVSI